jgi:hypothetical protein
MIPLSDALFILTGEAIAMFALGWWGSRAVGRAEWQEGYDEGKQEAIGTRIADSWDQEFGQPDLNDFVDTVLEQPGGSMAGIARASAKAGLMAAGMWDEARLLDTPEPPEPEPLEGTVGRKEGGGLTVPRLQFDPEPWTILDNPSTEERLATVAEARDDADYWVWRTEMASLIDGAAQWYDEEFHTGTFRAIR